MMEFKMMEFKICKDCSVVRNGGEGATYFGTVERLCKNTCWLKLETGEIVKGVPREELAIVQPEPSSSSDCSLDFIQGSEQHTSNWARFYLKGLETFQVGGYSTTHERYFDYACVVTEGTVFTVLDMNGNKYGTREFNFWICRANPYEFSTLESSYRCDVKVQGNFEIVTHGEGKTKAPRLMGWWVEFVGKNDELGRSQNEKMYFAQHCAEHINKRGMKKLPEFKMP
jgi:hypothetical protein